MKFNFLTAKILQIQLLLLLYVTAAVAGNETIQFKADNLVMDMGGKCIVETFSSNNLTFLNSAHIIDSIFYVRTTADYFFCIAYGDLEQPRIQFYDAVRFRYKWGTSTETKNADSFTTIADVRQTVKGTATNKHLLWMRESWLKIKLGDSDLRHYAQVGLIPYQVGRGISLGAAYDSAGFLGFGPGSSIDQFAPGFLLSFNPIKDRYIFDMYFALVENNQTSIDSNLEVIRKNEIGGCPQRGIGRQSYIAAIRNDILIYEKDKKKINIEPYILHQHAPDQDLEFTNDVNTSLSTAGCAVEGVYNRFNWGFEGAFNFGDIDIRPWDRNEIKIVKDDNGFLVEQYTKVFTQDPATVKKPQMAPASSAVATLLKATPQTTETNGTQIGIVEIDGVPTPIYTSFNRIRPEQRRLLKGFFFVGDATYEVCPRTLHWSVGIGYASGFNDPQRDGNKRTPYELMNEDFTGFLPLQSVYTGRRLDHLVIFNQGVPRFNVRLPNADLSQVNVTSVVQPDTVNEMTNIAFIGTRFEWKVPQLRKYAICLLPNIICYWIPEPAEFTLDDGKTTHTSDNFLGTELTLKFSGLFYDKLKLTGFFGALIPGGHYKDMCGTLIGRSQLPTGSDIGYVGNVGLSYLF